MAAAGKECYPPANRGRELRKDGRSAGFSSDGDVDPHRLSDMAQRWLHRAFQPPPRCAALAAVVGELIIRQCLPGIEALSSGPFKPTCTHENSG